MPEPVFHFISWLFDRAAAVHVLFTMRPSLRVRVDSLPRYVEFLHDVSSILESR